MARLVFMGSPALAVPSLRAVAAVRDVTVAGVFTQPPRPVGRKGTPQPSEVHRAADELGIPVATPDKSGGPEAMATLGEWRPDLILVCAYGRILPQRVLDLPPLGPYNLHFSLLPRWRGASPVQAAILAGDRETGVSLQRMVMELDAGPIAAETAPMPIAPDDTAGTLGARLAEAAAELIAKTLPRLLAGHPPLREQDPAGITHCGIIRKRDGALEFAARSAAEIERQIRAYTPWPGSFGYLGGRRIEITRAVLTPPPDPLPADAAPGTLLPGGRVPAREGWLQIVELKPEGKRPMPLDAFLRGQPHAVGQRILPEAG